MKKKVILIVLWVISPFVFIIFNLIYGKKVIKETQLRVLIRKQKNKNFNSFTFSQKFLELKQRKYPNFISPNIDYENLKNISRLQMISSLKSTQLSALIIDKNTSNPWVILCHGWTENKYEMIHLINFYLNKGFNVLAYDARFHGESGGQLTTIGYYEKNDLYNIIDWLMQKYSPEEIVLHGQSMGAATIIEYLKLSKFEHQQVIKAVISDAPFRKLNLQIPRYMGKILNQPIVNVYIGINYFAQKDWKILLRQVQPIKFIDLTYHTAILLIHSKTDQMIPSIDSEKMIKKIKETNSNSKSELKLFKTGDHVELYFSDQAQYTETIINFLNKHLKYKIT